MAEKVKITDELLHQARINESGEINRRQASLLGIPFPLKRGWKYVLKGRLLSEADAKLLVQIGEQARRSLY